MGERTRHLLQGWKTPEMYCILWANVHIYERWSLWALSVCFWLLSLHTHTLSCIPSLSLYYFVPLNDRKMYAMKSKDETDFVLQGKEVVWGPYKNKMPISFPFRALFLCTLPELIKTFGKAIKLISRFSFSHIGYCIFLYKKRRHFGISYPKCILSQ